MTFSSKDSSQLHIERDEQDALPPLETARVEIVPARSRSLSRRNALKLLLGTGTAAAALLSPVSAFAASASQETLNALDDAQSKFDEAQAKLDEISSNIEELSRQQAETASQIEELQGKIDETEQNIADKQVELEEGQQRLAARVADTYKNGDQDFLSTLLSTTSFEDFISTLFYANKVSEHDQSLIDEVRTIKEELEAQKAELESQKQELEDLNAQLESQLSDMKAQKAEAEDLVSNLDQEVQDLIAQRDAELAAAIEAEKEAQQQQSYPVYGDLVGEAGDRTSSEKQNAIVAACHRVPSPGVGWCAAWVSRVYAAAGLGSYSGNADDMYAWYCHSSNLNDLKVGMIIAVSSHSHTYAGRIYGHVGIYVGNNTVMHNVGSISSQSLESWINYYGTTVTPRWGWLGNLNIA